MSGRKTKLLLMVLCLMMLTGCWDAKDINKEDYLNTLGIDYEDGQYVVYVQVVNLRGIAKPSGGGGGGGGGGPTPAAIGKGRGKSLEEAVDQIVRASAMNLFPQYLSAIIFSDKLLKAPVFSQFLDEFRRSRFIRYGPWVYGTKEPMDSIFQVVPTTAQSQVDSSIHHPETNYHELSLIRPLSLRDFLADFQDRGHCTLLPSVAVTQQTWSKDTQKNPTIVLNGVYAFQNKKNKGCLSTSEIRGVEFLQDETEHIPVYLKKDEKTFAVLSLEKPHFKIKPRMVNHQLKFDVQVKTKAIVFNDIQKVSEDALRVATEQEVQKEIRQAFTNGLSIDADILQLGNSLYRKNVKSWHEQTHGKGELKLTSSSLGSIKVDVKIISTEDYKVKFK